MRVRVAWPLHRVLAFVYLRRRAPRLLALDARLYEWTFGHPLGE